MKIQTRDFGVMEIDVNEVIAFRLPIYGFEQLEKFVLLYDDSIPGPFSWLQSIEQADVCFILVDPQAVRTDYLPVLDAETRLLLELAQGDACVLRAIAVIPENFKRTTINLKSPIVINPRGRCAAQVILEADYPVRARLMPDDAEDGVC